MNVSVFYPNFVRKAITFTIDDGNLETDRAFLDIVKPAGIKGTFNLCSQNLSRMSAEEYRAFYDGYEIANHVKYHPYAMADGKDYPVKNEPFDPETADPAFLYPANVAGVYHQHLPRGWRSIADGKTYIRLADECRAELEAVFGEGSVRGFVWPFCRQENAELLAHLQSAGYYGLRGVRGGGIRDEENFDLPRDRDNWVYTATHETLTETAAAFAAYPDDGKLKWFAIGVHSVDFKKAGKWDDLRAFAKAFGNRPAEYWYATVGEIFAYEDAANALRVSETALENPTDTDLFLTCNGERVTLRRHTTVFL